MNVSRPYSVISSPLDVEALLVLRRTTRPLTGRDVARRASRGSTAGIRKALLRLTAHGIIQAEEAGRAILYTLNREHLAVPALEALASMQTELKRRLSTEIGGWSLQPNHVSIFGSAARGDGDTASDVDLFVVRPTGVDEEDPVWREQLARLASNTFSWTGNHLAVSEVDTDELRRLGQESPSVVDDLREDSITLAGGDVNLELNGTQ